MIEVTDQDELAAWRLSLRDRVISRYRACSDLPDWVEYQAEQRLAFWDEASEKHLFRVDGGLVALRSTDSPAWQLYDLWIEPAQRGRGNGSRALAAATAWAATVTDSLMVVVPPEPAAEGLLSSWPKRATNMLKQLESEHMLPARLTVRPLRHDEFDHFRELSLDKYVSEMVDSGLRTEDEARERAASQFAESLPDGVETPGNSIDCLEVAGEVVATTWLGHDYAPQTTWVNGVEVGAAHRGKGYGRVAMLAAENRAGESGDSQIGLNVFGHNDIAMSLYQSLGYRTVETIRATGV